MPRKKKTEAPKVSVKATVEPEVVTTSGYLSTESLLRKEEAPAPPNPPKKVESDQVRFRGAGMYLPIIDGKRVKVNFNRDAKYTYVAMGKAVIDWCDEQGFERV